MATSVDLKTKIDSLYPGRIFDMTEAVPGNVTVRYTKETTEEDKAVIQAIIDTFDWSASPPDIPAFFDGLVKAILSGAIPGDVHAKALMVKDLKSPADQAAALTAFSSDPSYTKEQKLILNTLIKESNLALPDVPGKE